MSLRRQVPIIVFITWIAGSDAITMGAPPDSPAAEARLKGAYRTEKDGWIFVHLEGTPEQVGFQHGHLLAAEIGDFLRVVKPYFKKTTGRGWEFYRQASERMLWPGIDEE